MCLDSSQRSETITDIVNSLLQEQTCIKTCFPSQILRDVTNVTSAKKNIIEESQGFCFTSPSFMT